MNLKLIGTLSFVFIAAMLFLMLVSAMLGSLVGVALSGSAMVIMIMFVCIVTCVLDFKQMNENAKK